MAVSDRGGALDRGGDLVRRHVSEPNVPSPTAGMVAPV